MKSHMSQMDHGIIGESAAMRALGRQIRTAASCDLTALVSGESGTGKELVARAIHLQSGRAKKPFVSLNCGTLTETLLESELFGYERGAFTGAHQKRKGLFEAAHTGTLFLDEIAEMSTSCQVKLLRVLQESAFRPVGGHVETSVDVRIIAATNRDLAQEMAAGRFRDDLYYRIAVLTISTPPLRKRPSDIPILIEHFLSDAQKKIRRSRQHRINQDAITALTAYSWPGNVRQLRHVIERLVATVANGATINADDIYRALPAAHLTGNTSQVPIIFHDTDSLDDFLDRTMLGLYDQLLAKTGSHSQTARLLRADRVSLYQRIERARQRVLSNGTY
ncbi:MAG: two-component system, NtrC family, response regulator HydG [Blastocatellia bacterium]|nr:two-component system, NtrC family, response regulator HydG [Blastocatellia bacterium]